MTFETFPQLWIELLQIIGVDDFVAQVQLCSYRQLCSNEPVDIHNNLGKERPLLLEYGIMIDHMTPLHCMQLALKCFPNNQPLAMSLQFWNDRNTLCF